MLGSNYFWCPAKAKFGPATTLAFLENHCTVRTWRLEGRSTYSSALLLLHTKASQRCCSILTPTWVLIHLLRSLPRSVAVSHRPMDPLSITASIIALLQLTNTVIGYLNDVKDASTDRARCALEASNLYNLLVTLRFRLEEGRPNEPWHVAVRALGVENGPLDQYKHALEQLQTKITSGRGINKLGNTLSWKFIKEEVTNILSRMERLTTLVQIALEMDHL